jgi:hypothetical protein
LILRGNILIIIPLYIFIPSKIISHGGYIPIAFPSVSCYGSAVTRFSELFVDRGLTIYAIPFSGPHGYPYSFMKIFQASHEISPGFH